MKKTILPLALLGAFSTAFACGGSNPCSATSGTSGSAAAGVQNSTYSAAASNGTGSAYQYNAVTMSANAAGAQSAGINTTGGKTTGTIDLTGTATTYGKAESYSLTSGNAAAFGYSTGESCAKVDGQGSFKATGTNQMTGSASGSATSQTNVYAGTASFGNGSSTALNVGGTTAGYKASVDATRQGATLNTDTKVSEAFSTSGKDLFSASTGNGVVLFNGVDTGGNAVSQTNATVGNLCGSVTACK